MTVGAEVYLVDRGPDEASTSRILVPRRQPIYDTNGYYRALGISTDATRRDIREAYQRLGGQESPRLTYIVKQLLDPVVRSRYDETPLGSFFLDAEIETWQRRAQALQVSALIEQGRRDLAEKLADDLGESLDGPPSDGEDEPDSPIQSVWGWGYFLHHSQCMDTVRLSLWQQYLVSGLGGLGFEGKVAVGFSGLMESPWEVARVGSRTLVLLHEGEWPTEDLARAAASRMVELEMGRSAVHHEHGDKDMSAPANFRRGTEEAKNASKGGANFARTEYFSLEDGKSTIVRFLDEPINWIVVDQHQMIPTKREPFAGWPKDAKWAPKRGAVCRNDVAFSDGSKESRCFICDHLVGANGVKKPSGRNWTLAAVREEVRENGQVVGYKDAVREVKVTREGKEETITEKRIVIVNMGYKNFFSILEGFAGRYGTLLDRDYYIKRDGADTDTTYHIVPNDPLPANNPDGVQEIFDLRQPYFAERYKHDINLGEVITELASEEFYAKFFDTRFTVVEEKDGDKRTGYKVVPTGSAPPQASEAASQGGAGSGIDQDRMAALQARVKSYGAGSTETPADEKVGASSGAVRDFG